MRRTALLCILGIFCTSAHAQTGQDAGNCSTQILAAVIVDMPPNTRDLDPRRLSCLGLAEVYFIQTGPGFERDFDRRREIEAVFRREGLTR